VREDALGERVRDLAPGRGAAGVHDTRARVPPSRPRPGRTRRRDRQVGDARGASLGEDGDGARAAEATAGRDRVLGVQSRIVVRADRGGDSTLREVTRGRLDRALREHDDVGLAGGAESGVEARDAPADDEKIAVSPMLSPCHVSHPPLVVFASESITVSESTRVSASRSENVRPRDAGGRLPGAHSQVAGAALAARQGSVRGHVVPPGRLPRPERDARESIAASLQRRSTSASFSHLEQLETLSEPARHPRERPARDGVLRRRPTRRRSRAAGGHELALRRSASGRWRSTTVTITLAGP
jgi:hypothetical protein